MSQTQQVKRARTVTTVYYVMISDVRFKNEARPTHIDYMHSTCITKSSTNSQGRGEGGLQFHVDLPKEKEINSSVITRLTVTLPRNINTFVIQYNNFLNSRLYIFHSALSSLISANLLLIAFSVLVGGTFLDTRAPTNAINPPNLRTQATPFLS